MLLYLGRRNAKELQNLHILNNNGTSFMNTTDSKENLYYLETPKLFPNKLAASSTNW